jgi:hypothetical protein
MQYIVEDNIWHTLDYGMICQKIFERKKKKKGRTVWTYIWWPI